MPTRFPYFELRTSNSKKWRSLSILLWWLGSNGSSSQNIKLCGFQSSTVRPALSKSVMAVTPAVWWVFHHSGSGVPGKWVVTSFLTILWLLFSHPSPLLLSTWSTFSESLISKKTFILTSHMNRHNITFLKILKLLAHVFSHPKLLVRRLVLFVFFFLCRFNKTAIFERVVCLLIIPGVLNSWVSIIWSQYLVFPFNWKNPGFCLWENFSPYWLFAYLSLINSFFLGNILID